MLWIIATTQYRGSGWAALALGSRLALGAAASTFFALIQAPDRKVRGLFYFAKGGGGAFPRFAPP
jgi:hypothetical protein